MTVTAHSWWRALVVIWCLLGHIVIGQNGGTNFIAYDPAYFVALGNGLTVRNQVPHPNNCKNTWWSGFKAMYIQANRGVNYASGADCDLHIAPSVPRTSYINVTLAWYDIKINTNGTCKDYLQFFSDELLKAPETPPICGQGVNMNFFLGGNMLHVRYVTDTAPVGRGFEMTYVTFVNVNDWAARGSFVSGSQHNYVIDTSTIIMTLYATWFLCRQ